MPVDKAVHVFETHDAHLKSAQLSALPELKIGSPCQRRSDFASAGRSNIASVLNA
jgi:hypothetical protein